jgi:hypothetical protein
MNMTLRAIKAKLKKLGLLTETGQALAYSQFKNFATIKEYGKKNRIGTYPDMLREAYDWYKRIVHGDLGPIHEKSVIIGNTGIPDEYEEIVWEN